MKKFVLLFILIVMLILAGCGEKSEAAATAEAQNNASSEASEEKSAENEVSGTEPQKTDLKSASKSEPQKVTFTTELDLGNVVVRTEGYQPERVYAGSEDWGEDNPFSIFDGYYLYGDANNYACYVRMQDGYVYFETRGEEPEGTTTEMYVENNHAYVEFDGKIIQLGKKDMYTLEYAPLGDYFPSQLTAISDEYVEDMYIAQVQRIIDSKKAMDERIKEQAEAKEKAEEEAAKQAEEEKQLAMAAEEEKKAAKEEKKATEEAKEKEKAKAKEERQAKLAEKRKSSGWVKAEVDSYACSPDYNDFYIKIIESNYDGVNPGDVIEIVFEPSEYCNDDCNLLNYSQGGFSGSGNGVSFEFIIGTHKCGRSGYVIADFIG